MMPISFLSDRVEHKRCKQSIDLSIPEKRPAGRSHAPNTHTDFAQNTHNLTNKQESKTKTQTRQNNY